MAKFVEGFILIRSWPFLCSFEIYKHNKEERIARTWGTVAPGLPYVEEAIANTGDWLIGGDLEVLDRIRYNDGLDHYRLSPAELRAEFERREVKAPSHEHDLCFIFYI